MANARFRILDWEGKNPSLLKWRHLKTWKAQKNRSHLSVTSIEDKNKVLEGQIHNFVSYATCSNPKPFYIHITSLLDTSNHNV